MQPNNKIFITRDWHEEAVNYLCEKKYEVITWKNITSPTESEIINILKFVLILKNPISNN